ncbi:MAG: hypothetical protein ACHQKY_05945 [Terriglobia bacterium]
MKRSTVAYLVALLITLAAAYYQRVTGPTYPAKGKVTLDGQSYSYRLPRSYDGPDDCEVRLKQLDPSIQGRLSFRRLGAGEAWRSVSMLREKGDLIGTLPHQPPAGKMEYTIALSSPAGKQIIGGDSPIKIRFRGVVPLTILIPHVTCMFLAMWASTAAGLKAVRNMAGYKTIAWLTVAFLVLGGMILGPMVQHHAFGEYWTGVPFGYDLTDNKTLIALVGWLLALLANWKKERTGAIIAAAVLLLVVYSIPHSVLGSHLDYSSMKVKTG